MLSIAPGRRIWLCVQPTDMRRSFDGLSALVRSHLGEDPTSGQWFAFINRRRTQIKVLAFEQGGYWVWSKRANRWALREGDWKLVKYGKLPPAVPGDWQLFNLREDPRESADVAQAHPRIVERLHRSFLAQHALDQ